MPELCTKWVSGPSACAASSNTRSIVCFRHHVALDRDRLAARGLHRIDHARRRFGIALVVDRHVVAARAGESARSAAPMPRLPPAIRRTGRAMDNSRKVQPLTSTIRPAGATGRRRKNKSRWPTAARSRRAPAQGWRSPPASASTAQAASSAMLSTRRRLTRSGCRNLIGAKGQHGERDDHGGGEPFRRLQQIEIERAPDSTPPESRGNNCRPSSSRGRRNKARR